MSNDKYKGNVAAEAWDKTKTEGDPDYAAIPNGEFRSNLDYRAAKVQETGIAITNFEKEVAAIIAKRPKDDSPMAVTASNVNFAAVAEGQTKDGGNAVSDDVEPAEDHVPEAADPDDNKDAINELTRKSRGDLNKMAKKQGLDGKSFANKQELAAALVEGASKSTTKTKDPSKHVPGAKEKEATAREQANAPLHP